MLFSGEATGSNRSCNRSCHANLRFSRMIFMAWPVAMLRHRYYFKMLFYVTLFCIWLQTCRRCLDTTFILLITTITTIIISITKHILHNAVVIVTLLMISWWTTRYFTYKLKKTKLILKANAVNCASVQYLSTREKYHEVSRQHCHHRVI